MSNGQLRRACKRREMLVVIITILISVIISNGFSEETTNITAQDAKSVMLREKMRRLYPTEHIWFCDYNDKQIYSCYFTSKYTNNVVRKGSVCIYRVEDSTNIEVIAQTNYTQVKIGDSNLVPTGLEKPFLLTIAICDTDIAGVVIALAEYLKELKSRVGVPENHVSGLMRNSDYDLPIDSIKEKDGCVVVITRTSHLAFNGREFNYYLKKDTKWNVLNMKMLIH